MAGKVPWWKIVLNILLGALMKGKEEGYFEQKGGLNKPSSSGMDKPADFPPKG